MIKTGKLDFAALRLQPYFCLLLAVSFLFNPFFVASPSQHFPSFNHLPSYRANVASSELLKFKADGEVAVIQVVENDILRFSIAPKVQNPAVPRVRPVDEVSISQLLSPGSIWFRPPPAI